MKAPASFRFEAETHTYYDAAGLVVPHITGLLERGGWIDDRWYTEESSARGRLVHTLTADYDLGAVDVATCVSRGRPYLLAHIECLRLEPPTFEEIEEPWVHPGLRFGGRPDRAGRLRSGARVVWEIKSGAKAKAHSIQTALQAILLEQKHGLPAEMWVRLCEYLDHRGRCKLVDHKETQAADFAEARRLLYQARRQQWAR